MDSAVKLVYTPDPITGKAPGACVVIIEEFDSLGSKVPENNSSTEFLRGINSEVKKVFETDAYPELIICASVNRIGILDPPIKQRFPTPIVCVLPDVTTRCEILLHFLKKNNATLDSSINLKNWYVDTYLYSGRDIAEIAKEIISKVKKIKRRWIYDAFNEYYFPIDNVDIKCDYEGSADDLEFENKKYNNLIVTNMETTKIYRMSEKEFITYMEDAVECDPSIEELFINATKKFTTKSNENINGITNDILNEIPNEILDEIPNEDSGEIPGEKCKNNNSTKFSENMFKDASAEIWKMILESINGSDDTKLNNEKFTKIVMDMMQKQMNIDKNKIENDGKNLNDLKIRFYFKNHSEIVYSTLEIDKNETIMDLKKIIHDHEDFKKINNANMISANNSESESCPTLTHDNIILIDPESSIILNDNDIIENVLKYNGVVQFVKHF